MNMKKNSLWFKNINFDVLPRIKENKKVDILIVGGGITGLSILYALKNSPYNVLLVERGVCGTEVTSRSTAKVTYLQEKLYMNIRKCDIKKAKMYLKSQRESINILKNIIEKENIDCDFVQSPSYTYTSDVNKIDKINEEYEFLKGEGIEAELLDKVPFIENIKKAVKVTDTYTFHPIKFINGLKNILKDNILEKSKLEKIDKIKDTYISVVNGFIIESKYIILANHYPDFLIPLLFPLKTSIEVSYVAAKKVTDYNEFNAINIDSPTKSLRYYKEENENYSISINKSLNTCNVECINKNFDFKNAEYLWSNNDVITSDNLPLIGRIYKKDDTFLIATGYNTWGMTNSILSGRIISDIILKKNNPYIELFKPTRLVDIQNLIKYPINIGSSAKAFIKSTKANVNNKNIEYSKIKGKSVAIYTDSRGIKHIVLNRCPHLKCGLVFNDVEKTWDCLCHGSRFDIDGHVIEGPSNYDISFRP